MSVPVGTLTDECRAELLRFYGGHFGWTELEALEVGVGTYRHFRFRYLLPMSVEVQHLPAGEDA